MNHARFSLEPALYVTPAWLQQPGNSGGGGQEIERVSLVVEA